MSSRCYLIMIHDLSNPSKPVEFVIRSSKNSTCFHREVHGVVMEAKGNSYENAQGILLNSLKYTYPEIFEVVDPETLQKKNIEILKELLENSKPGE